MHSMSMATLFSTLKALKEHKRLYCDNGSWVRIKEEDEVSSVSTPISVPSMDGIEDTHGSSDDELFFDLEDNNVPCK